MRSDTAAVPQSTLSAPSGGPQRVAEQTFHFDGFAYHCRIVHQDAPTAPPMVLLGGASQNRHAWLRHEKWLAAPCTLITVDLPGYGAGDFLPAHYGFDFLAAVVRHMLSELGIARINLVGACFGAAVALRFAQHYPAYVARLAMSGMTLTLPEQYAAAAPRWTGLLERGELTQVATELVEQFMSPSGAGPVRKREVVSRLLYQQFMGQSADDVRKVLEHNVRMTRIEWYRPEPLPAVPGLVFTGEHDTFCTPDMGREVAALLPGADFTTVTEADHLVPVERMAEYSDLLVQFCTGRPLTGLTYCHPFETPSTAPARPGVPAPQTRGGRTHRTPA
jgi:pimeloyl-ACP methyl ester carboxylesterase